MIDLEITNNFGLRLAKLEIGKLKIWKSQKLGHSVISGFFNMNLLLLGFAYRGILICWDCKLGVTYFWIHFQKLTNSGLRKSLLRFFHWVSIVTIKWMILSIFIRSLCSTINFRAPVPCPGQNYDVQNLWWKGHGLI